jgi:thiamine transporter
MALGFYAPPAQTVAAFVGVILLDYVLALRFWDGRVFWPPFKNRIVQCRRGRGRGRRHPVFMQLPCRAFSSGQLRPEGTPVWLYSLTYNGSYMLPEIVITVVVTTILVPVLDRIGGGTRKQAA